MLGMVFCGFNAVKDRKLRMSIREVRFARRQQVVFSFTIQGGLAVVSCRLFVMVGCRGMVLRATKTGLYRSCGPREICGKIRNGRRIFSHRAGIQIYVIFVGLLCAIYGLPGMPDCHQCLMRRMGMIYPDLIMSRSLTVISRRQLVMACRDNVMFRCPILWRHNFTDRLSRVIPNTA